MAYTIPDGFELVTDAGSNPAPARAAAPAAKPKSFAIPDGFEPLPEQPATAPPLPPARPGAIDLPNPAPTPPPRPGYIDSAPVMQVPPDVKPGVLSSLLDAAKGALPEAAPASPVPQNIPPGVAPPVYGWDGQPTAQPDVANAGVQQEGPWEHIWNKTKQGYEEGARGFEISEEDKKNYPNAAAWARTPMGALGALFGAGMAVPRGITGAIGSAAEQSGIVDRDTAQRLERGLDAGVDFEFTGQGPKAPSPGAFRPDSPHRPGVAKPGEALPPGFDLGGALSAAERQRRQAEQEAAGRESYTYTMKDGEERKATPTDPAVQDELKAAEARRQAQEAQRASERPAEEAAAAAAAAEKARKEAEAKAAAEGQPAPEAPSAGMDTGQNMPETPETLKAQQEQLAAGTRRAQMFPKGTPELDLPAGMERVETERGVFHFDPKKITADEIRDASAKGRENDILDLGPASKADVDASAAAGSERVNVTERAPDGTEVKTATGTQETAPAQAEAMEATKTPGNTVQAEPLDKTIIERENGLLRGMGWSDADISKMPPEQRADQVREAMDSGVEPVAAKPGETGANPAGGVSPGADIPADAMLDDAAPPKTPGTREAPIKASEPEHVDAAAAQAAEPTPAQAEAGNYRKGHVVTEDGLHVTIENPKGSVRKGVGEDGKPWETTMPAHYGYVKGTIGADGDHVDVYVGPKKANGKAFVVDQIDPKTGKFDEHKVITNVDSLEEAAHVYASGFSDGSGHSRMGAITETTPGHVKEWLGDGQKKTDPFGKLPETRENLFAKDTDPSFLKNMSAADREAFEKGNDANKATAIKIGHAIDNLKAKDPKHPRVANLEEKLKGVLDTILPNRDTSRRPPPGYERPGAKAHDAWEADRPRRERAARAKETEAYADEQANYYAANDVGGFQAENHMRSNGHSEAFIKKVGKKLDKIYRDYEAAAEAEAAKAMTPEQVADDLYELGVRSTAEASSELDKGSHTSAFKAATLQKLADRLNADEAAEAETAAKAAEEAKRKQIAESPVADILGRARRGATLTDTERAFLNENALASGSREAWKTGSGLALSEKGRRLLDKGGEELAQHDADWQAYNEAASASLAQEPPAGATPSPFDPKKSLPDAFADHFFRGNGFQTIVQARKFAKDAGHELTPKQVEEALEHGVVKASREIVAKAESPADAYNQLVALYERQPNLSARTGKSIELQAYSTPAPLAYVASRLAGIDKAKRVLEPTAGNGMLVMDANPKTAFVNEIDPERAANLRDQGFDPHELDASAIKLAPDYDVVIANPPFGTVKGEGGKNVRFDMKEIQPGYVTGEIDHAIALRALEGMKDDGKAVLILGGLNKLLTTREARSDGYNGKAKREFFLTLYKNYNVVDHFTVAGELYTKQGAGWPVDVIVIHGRGKSARALPAVDVPAILSSWDELKGKLDGAGVAETGRPSDGRDSGPARETVRPSEPGGAEAGGAERGATPDAGGRAAEGDRSGRQPEGADGRADAGQPEVPVADPAAETVSRPGAERGEPKRSGAEAPAGEHGLGERSGPKVPDSNDGLSADETLAAERKRAKVRQRIEVSPEVADQLREAADDARADYRFLLDPEERTVAKVRRDRHDDDKWTEEGKWPLTEGGTPLDLRYPDGDLTPNHFRYLDEAEEPKAKKPKKQEQETEGQVAYTPHSKRAQGLGTLVPKNMKTATEDALKRVSEKRGDTDKFVADALGMKVGEISKYFSAEQADALALALDNFEKGAGFIIGDQTGIGKGRIVAGVIRYTLNKGLTPIFVTEKPNLYGDMWRDMGDVGLTEFLGREPRVFMTNTDDVPLGGGATLKGSTGPKRNAELQQIARTGELPDHDMIFTTYNQMQTVKQAETARHGALRAIAPKAVLILDEAHNAGGGGAKAEGFEDKGGLTRAEFVRELVQQAQSVFYSSATYAKRPDVMDLYSKTDMGKAVSGESLAETIKNGGVPMQQVVAAMLSRAGQYMRRERSFAGVQYDVRVAPVDKKVYANLSKSLAAINDFSRAVKGASKEIKEEIKATAKSMGMDTAVGDAGASSTNFTSIMHNVIAQAVLAMKADGAADRAIEKIKAGEKPVITVANTMGSFIAQVAEEMGLHNGDAMPVTFGKLLDRYLERTRTITIKEPYSKLPAEKIYLTDKQLGPAGVAAYKAAKAVLAKADFSSLPVSPIDHIIQRIKDAGYSVGEITGRSDTLDYSNPQETRYKVRQQKEISIAGRRAVIDGFNDGTLDAVILNRAGSTGLSLHASAAFKDQRKRHMILAQPEENIDTHMQMLGRIHRTGQVVLPSYDQLVADIPAEKRPAAVLAKKMASLNASTTASRKGALSSDAVADIMNEYGDQVAYDVMRENPDTHKLLDEPLNLDDEEPKEGSMRKVTGRVPLLDIPDQERIYASLESAYHDLVAQKEADGESVLEAKLLDLDARLVERQVLVNGDGESPFTEPVVLETHDVKRQTKPYTGDDFARQLGESNMGEGGVAPVRDEAAMKALQAEWADRQKKTQLEARNDFTAFRRRQLEGIEKEATREGMNARYDQNDLAFKQLMDTLVPGRSISILNPETGERQSGVVISMERHGDAQNPIALGSWRIKFAQPGQGVRTIPLSQLYAGYGDPPVKTMKPVEARYDTPAKAAESFDEMAKDTREKRVIVTGNILSGFAAVKGRGQITNFVDSEGNIRQGILLKANIKSAADLAATIGKPLKSAGEVQAYLKELGPEVSMRSKDGAVTIMRMRNGDLAVSVPKSKKDGGKYYLDAGVKSALAGPDRWSGKEFSGRGQIMRVDVWGDMEPRLLDALIKAGANFETKPKATTAGPKQHASAESMRRVDDLASEARVSNLKPEVRQDFDQLIRDVREIIGRVGGTHVNAIKFEAQPFDVGAAAMQASAGREGKAGGSYSDFIRLIRVALTGVDDVRSTAYHEAMHALERGGAFTPQEMRLLERETARLREKIGRVYGVEPERLAKISDEEVRAYAFEDYAYGADRAPSGDPENPHIGVRHVFEKVRRILARIRDYLRGRGWTRAEDVFKKAYRGDMGRREARGEGARMSAADVRDVIRDRGMDQRFGFQESASGMKRYPNGDRRYFADETVKEKISRSLNTLRREAGTYAKENFQDYSQRLLDLQRQIEDMAGPQNQTKRPYDSKRLLQGRTKAVMDEFNESHLHPLLDAIKEHGLTRQDVAEYVFAKHAPERNALMDQRDPNNMGKGSGVDDMEAQAILTRLGPKVATMDQHIAPIVQRIRDFNLDHAVRGGILSKNAADEWRAQMPSYVPLTGFEDASLMPDQHYFREGRKLGIFGKESETAFGRANSISADPLASLVRQSYRVIDRVERNRTGMTLWRALRQLSDQERKDLGVKLDEGDAKKVIDPTTGLMKFVEKSPFAEPERVVSLKIGGQPHHIVFDDARMAKAINRMGANQLPMIAKQMKAAIDIAKSMWTHYNPDFIPRHFAMRYPIEAIMNAGEHGLGAMGRATKGFPLRAPMRAIMKAHTLDAAGRAALLQKFNSGQATESERFQHYYLEARKAGAVMDFNALSDLDSLKRYMDEAVARISAKGQTADAMRGYARGVHRVWNNVLQAMDNAHRLVAYIEARDRGEDVTKAALAARDSTVDFGMRGSLANWINLYWPFGNTAIQTSARMGTAWGRAGMLTSKFAGLAIGGSFAAGFIAAMFNYLFGGEDENGTPYHELLPDYTRRLNMVLIVPGTKDRNGEPYALTIALPYNYAMPYTWGQAAAYGFAKAAGYAKEKASHVGHMVTHAMLEGLVGLPQEASLLAKVTPALLVPSLHVAMNQNFFGAPVHTPYPKDGLAHSWQGRASAGAVWDATAKGVNSLTGGDRYTPGALDFYPEDFKEQLGWFTSAFERFGKKTVSGSLGDIGSGKMPVPEETPLLNTLLKSSKSYGQARQAAYYEMRNDLRAKSKAYDEAVKDGDVEAAERLMGKNGKEIGAHVELKKFETALRTINRHRNTLARDKTTPDAERERISKELDEQTRTIQNQASKVLGRFIE